MEHLFAEYMRELAKFVTVGDINRARDALAQVRREADDDIAHEIDKGMSDGAAMVRRAHATPKLAHAA